ncbi:adenine phosphoribosyltransferase [Convivina praedatoris]|uniref:Adenine phosphoribosyltransferase n=1 Tax=Convivina praedatoris TaxID=2880963 RepID=A0ABM9D4R8_9LACO|nr:adenine phosphoribosyltransferase [Convivina sp. LMG 32447]CAH1854398.1 Adenine phosphoribosyltransferase [Convivina sp. LMG 32447]CAH1855624.1 Adenine phosphoribosyltransferase [Convivina sp. LMG 32447]CAH1855715.1 Adenine phosphoribosyltransferase [Convivina sp. LMG 32447]
MKKIDLHDYVATVKDYPEPGISFRDISPLMGSGLAYREAINQIQEFAKDLNVDLIAGPESRGFIVGSPLAYALGVGFVPARKSGKLPRAAVSASYTLEYGGINELEIHQDAIKPGQRILIVDDLLATGGTINATREIIEKLGGVVAGVAFIIELEALHGREKIMEAGEVPFLALMEY